jgi:ketosteroid isomerase-like protein
MALLSARRHTRCHHIWETKMSDSNTSPRPFIRSADRLQFNLRRRIPNVHRAWTVLLASSVGLCCLNIHVALAQTGSQAKTEKANADRALIKSVLTEQTKAWNEGNLVKFMETYRKSDKLTFSSGGKTTYGWQATLDNYKKSYAPPKQMGQLHFDGLEISMIESNSALVLGNWHLKMKDGQKRDGNFSLVVKKFKSGWKIIHDHSSSVEPDEDAETEKKK